MDKKIKSNWLRDHLHHFVYPMMMAYENGDDAAFSTNHFPDPQNTKRISKEDESICKAILADEVEKLFTPGVRIKRRPKWDSKLGYRYVDEKVFDAPFCDNFDFYLVYDALNRLQTIANKENRKIVFPGRDCWPFYVCAMKRGMDVVYIPQLSRDVANRSDVTAMILRHHKINGSEIFFDTGFQGSIFKALKHVFETDEYFTKFQDNMLIEEIEDYKVARWKMYGEPKKISPCYVCSFNYTCYDCSTYKTDKIAYDIWVKDPAAFPKQIRRELRGYLLSNSSHDYTDMLRKNSYRSSVLQIEECPKYFGSGFIDWVSNKDTAVQVMHNKGEFYRAAAMTVALWRGLFKRKEYDKKVVNNGRANGVFA